MSVWRATRFGSGSYVSLRPLWRNIGECPEHSHHRSPCGYRRWTIRVPGVVIHTKRYTYHTGEIPPRLTRPTGPVGNRERKAYGESLPQRAGAGPEVQSGPVEGITAIRSSRCLRAKVKGDTGSNPGLTPVLTGKVSLRPEATVGPSGPHPGQRRGLLRNTPQQSGGWTREMNYVLWNQHEQQTESSFTNRSNYRPDDAGCLQGGQSQPGHRRD